MSWKVYVIPTNGPILITWCYGTFPEWHQSQIEKKKKKKKERKKKTLGTGDDYTAQPALGIDSGPAMTQAMSMSSTMNSLTQFRFFVHGNILNKQTHKKQLA